MIEERGTMPNISKIKRQRMLAFLEELKKTHSDDASIRAFNEIENHIREKKFGLVFEEHTEEVDEMLKNNIPVLCEDKERRICKDDRLPWNFIIEGDNLQALYLLEKTHKGKVDCIYIDPPYNTGAKDWKYNNDYVDGNDAYRHSKWLSMMESRLKLAKTLLDPKDSVLICTIDEKEYLHLGCLLEETFPEAKIQMVSSCIMPGGVSRGNEFARSDEYLYFVKLGSATPVPLQLSDEWLGGVKNTSRASVHWEGLLRTGTNNMRSDRPNLFYPIFVSRDGKRFLGVGDPLKPTEDRTTVIPPQDAVAIWPLHADRSEGCWRIGRETLLRLQENHVVRLGGFTSRGMAINYLKQGEYAKVLNGTYKILGINEDNSYILDDSGYKPSFIPSAQWSISSHDASRHGSGMLRKIFGAKIFPFPKSLYATHDTIRFFVANKPNALIVDFFAGSGTTFHAVNLLNAEDGGHRRCIMVTNNEVSLEDSQKLTEHGFHKGDPEWEAHGIAKYVTWPRTLCSIEGRNIHGAPLKGDYLGKDASGEPIPMARGFVCNVKYFQCVWTPRRPEEYLLSNALCLYIKEMIELQNGIEVDNVKNVLILNKEDFRKYVMDEEIYQQIERVWVNQNIVFHASEMERLNAIGFKYIPKEFFGQELKEAAE